MGFFKSAQEAMADTDCYAIAFIGVIDNIHRVFCVGTVCLYIILIEH